MGLKDTFQAKGKEFQESSQWDKVKTNYKKVETGVWKGLEPVGKWSNKQVGKLGMEAFWPTSMDLECDKAARILRTFTSKGATVEVPISSQASDDQAVIPPAPTSSDHKNDSRKTQKVIKKISAKTLAEAKGIVIFTVFRTGLGVSGASGSGVVLKKLENGEWSSPSGILVHTIGWGFLVGLDIYDVVLILRSDKAVKSFESPKISLGGELSVTAGPVGNGVMLDSGIEASPCWSYVKSKGFYAGVQLDGNFILQRGDENARFYGAKASAAEILSGKFNNPPPKDALPLLQTLYTSEGKPERLGTDRIPDNEDLMSPGDIEIREEDLQKDGSEGSNLGTTQPIANVEVSPFADPQDAQTSHIYSPKKTEL